MVSYNILIKSNDNVLIVENSGRYYLMQNKIIIGESTSFEGLVGQILKDPKPYEWERLTQPITEITPATIATDIVSYLTSKEHPSLGTIEFKEGNCSRCGADMERGTWSNSYASGGGGGEQFTCINKKCGWGYCFSDW